MADSLKPSNDRYCAFAQGLLDTSRRDVNDPCPTVRRVGNQASLRAGVGASFKTVVMDCHRKQGHRYPLSGGEQHVEFTSRRVRADLLRQINEVIGGVTHGGDHHDHFIAGPPGIGNPSSYPLNR